MILERLYGIPQEYHNKLIAICEPIKDDTIIYVENPYPSHAILNKATVRCVFTYETEIGLQSGIVRRKRISGETYVESYHLRPKTSNKRRFIIVGKGGSGKSTLVKYLQSLGLTFAKSTTSREKRNEEINSVSDYIHISKPEFEQGVANSEFLQYAYQFDNYYGTSVQSWLESDLFIMSPSGIKQLHPFLRSMATVIYVDATDAEICRRLQNRGDSNITKRMNTDKEMFSNFNDFEIKIAVGFQKHMLDLLV